MTTDKYILDAEGEPVVEPDLFAWARWLETAENRVLKQEWIWGCRVSTVFLGLDHNLSPGGLPVLWETMVFGGPLDGAMDRYCRREDALTGHELMENRVRAAAFNPAAWWTYLRYGSWRYRWTWRSIKLRWKMRKNRRSR